MTNRLQSTVLPVVLGLFVSALMISGCGQAAETTIQETKDSSNADKDGFVSMFDGKTFTGWEGDTAFWRIDSASFIGEVTPTHQPKNNTFLIWRADSTKDFEFKAEYRISAGGNSGIQYRSEELKDIPLALKGYQADIDGANQYTGQNYEERGRGFLAMRGQNATIKESNGKPIVTDTLGNSDSLKAYIKPGWNEIYLVVKDNHMKHYVNGILMSEFTDNDTANRKFTGVLGLQIHVLPSMKVEYRNLKYKKD
jgi:hypothetical protein